MDSTSGTTWKVECGSCSDSEVWTTRFSSVGSDDDDADDRSEISHDSTEDSSTYEHTDENDSSDEAWGNTPTKPNVNDDPPVSWDEIRLQTQLGSWSLVMRTLAASEILVDGLAEPTLVKVEEQALERIARQRAIFMAKRRRDRTTLIDTAENLQSLLDRLSVLDHTKPQVVIDCEGLNFKRTNTIDVMELFVRPEDKLYLIDVVALGKSAWTTEATDSDFCLHQFLSSPTDKKIMWDLRMDAHILHVLYGIRLRGIIDSSLWAVAYRRHGNARYDGCRMSIETACVENLQTHLDRSELESLQEAKRARVSLPPRPWAIRPLPEILVDYAADVKYMGMLYDCLRRELHKRQDLVAEIEDSTEQELSIACDPLWPADSEREPASPWTSGYLEGARTNLEESRREMS